VGNPDQCRVGLTEDLIGQPDITVARVVQSPVCHLNMVSSPRRRSACKPLDGQLKRRSSTLK
jgi:hypothetical protein